uniref:Adenylate/guanylate cyclase domain-containing protein n=1 Tax=candidate division WOR-3 bacterium TaxID=2052148 RepID=A0A7C4YHU1_UNCW3
MRKFLNIVFFSIIIFLIVFVLLEFIPLHLPVEMKFYDLKQRINLEEKYIPEDIVIVDIDDRSIDELGRYQNWPRYYFGKVIERISIQEPLVIGVDFIFSEPDTMNSLIKEIYKNLLKDKIKTEIADTILNIFSFDRYLSSAINMSGKVVLAGIVNNEKRKEHDIKRYSIKDEIKIYPEYNGIIYPLEEFLINSYLGIINVNADFDGIVRNVPLLFNYRSSIIPSFSLSVVNVMKMNLSVCEGKIGIGDNVIEIEKNGIVHINYLCNIENLKKVSFSDVYFDRVNPDFFRNKIVLIGSSASALSDLRNTPVGIMPGIYIHSNIILNILNNNFIKLAPLWLNYIIGFLLIFFITIIAIRTRPIISIILFVIFLVSYIIFNILTYIIFLYSFEFTRPILGIITSYLFGLGFRIAIVEAERRKLRQTFSKYVSPDIVEKILSSKDFYIKGERKEITVLFCDIRDYTGYSEDKPPELVVKTLNEYFDEMSNIIFAYNGMVDKFIGDGIMAIFGAPLNFPGHADKAVSAGIEMVKKVKELNKKWVKEKGRSFEIGIGINTGIAIVGNVGSQRRIEYTAIGDVVNTAARIEPLNKEYSTNILISETTFSKLQNEYNYRNLGKVRIRGKKEEITIYEIIIPF